jgi:S-adenosylmethionine-diacylglycerol 3-amino-3-carboxypropyl transferase
MVEPTLNSPYFTRLNYSLGDEDPYLDQEVMPAGCRHAVTVSGSGIRVLGMLAKRPKILTCVDILEEQLALTRLRLAAIQTLDLATYKAFFGYPPHSQTSVERRLCFAELPIEERFRAPLEAILNRGKWTEIIYYGRFERTMRCLAKVLSAVAGGKAGRLCASVTLDEQRDYLHRHFPRRRWRALLFLMGNAAVLNALLYKGAFPRKNVPGSAYTNYKAMFGRLFENTLVAESFFAQMLLRGRIDSERTELPEISAKGFGAIKAALAYCDIRLVRGDIITEASRSHPRAGFVSLSDVPSFLSERRQRTYLQEMRAGLSKGALVLVRGNLRVTSPELRGYEELSGAYVGPISRERTQLWRVNVYQAQS